MAPDCRDIEILLFERFSNHCLANALEPFRAANTLANRQAYRWRIFTPGGVPAVSSSGLPVLPDGPLEDAGRGGMVFVVSSYGHRDLDRPATRSALRRIAAQAELVAGMDTGAWLMAAAGLLDGRRATIHWDILDSFAETVPAGRGGERALRHRRRPFDLRRGDNGLRAGAGTDPRATGRSAAARCGGALHARACRYLIRPPPAYAARSRTTARAVTMMQENLEQPLAIAALAGRWAVPTNSS